jgi:hypothetical protein
MPKKKTNNWKKHAKKEYVIIAYSPVDKYELPLKLYFSFQEMADDLNEKIDRVYNLVECGYTYRKTKLKYVKVRCN